MRALNLGDPGIGDLSLARILPWQAGTICFSLLVPRPLWPKSTMGLSRGSSRLAPRFTLTFYRELWTETVHTRKGQAASSPLAAHTNTGMKLLLSVACLQSAPHGPSRKILILDHFIDRELGLLEVKIMVKTPSLIGLKRLLSG